MINVNEIHSFERLLLNFQKIQNVEEVLPTYIEIAGYPRFENVSSNILAFFLDSRQKHNLKDLVIISLLECIQDLDPSTLDLETLNVYREYTIKNQKRIDLVIEFNKFCISIENKIFHWLHNDLELYEEEIDKDFKNERNFHFVLGIRKEQVKGKFISITYEEFFTKIKSNLGFYAIKGSNTYISYLLDFMQTIENHYKMENINKDMFQFLISNQKEIENLQNEKLKLNNALQRFILQLVQRIDCEAENVKQWIYQKNVIVYDFTFEDVVIAVDIAFYFDKVIMDIFDRGGKSKEILNSLALLDNNNFNDTKRGKLIFEKDVNFYDIDLDDFAEKLSNYLNQIVIKN